VGTFTAWDGAKYIPSLANKYPYVEFHMYGNGILRDDIEKESPTNVLFHGYVQYEKLKTLYSDYDAGIVLYEKQRNDMKLSSLKTLEYMASGLPIYTTDVPGQEYVKNNNIGMNVPVENIVEYFQAFIDSVEYFKQNVQKYRGISKEEISWLSVAKKTREVLIY
jgi:glycosyltransferase involved in cell wall biosynthesis